MERSTKHGARLDDVMDKETEDLQRAGKSGRSQEWREMEPAGEDQVGPDLIPEDSMDVYPSPTLSSNELELRAEIAQYLRKSIWPAPGGVVLATAVEENAPGNLLELLESLPEGRVYENMQEVWSDLGGRTEER